MFSSLKKIILEQKEELVEILSETESKARRTGTAGPSKRGAVMRKHNSGEAPIIPASRRRLRRTGRSP